MHLASLSRRLVLGDIRAMPWYDGSASPPPAPSTQNCVSRESMCVAGVLVMDPGRQLCLSDNALRQAQSRSRCQPMRTERKMYSCGERPSIPLSARACCQAEDVNCVLPCGGYTDGFCRGGKVHSAAKTRRNLPDLEFLGWYPPFRYPGMCQNRSSSLLDLENGTSIAGQRKLPRNPRKLVVGRMNFSSTEATDTSTHGGLTGSAAVQMPPCCDADSGISCHLPKCAALAHLCDPSVGFLTMGYSFRATKGTLVCLSHMCGSANPWNCTHRGHLVSQTCCPNKVTADGHVCCQSHDTSCTLMTSKVSKLDQPNRIVVPSSAIPGYSFWI